MSFRLGVVILGAGASSRMGRPKLLLSWGDTTVVGHLLRQWTSLNPDQIAVVCSPNNQDTFPWPDRILNPTPEDGMFSSIRSAARWAGWDEQLTHWAIALGDQPQVQLETLQRVVAFASEHPEFICQPSHHGRPRHPVVLPAKWFRDLRDTQAEDLKRFLQAHEANRRLLKVDDPGLDLDLDSPQDYEDAKRRFLSISAP